MLSITGVKKNHQLLTDLNLLLPWTLNLIFFFFSCSAVSVTLAGFSEHCLLGGTMISLFLSTFIYSSVSMQFLAVGGLSVPILVHLLTVRLKPLKCAASWFLTVFLEAWSSESFLPQEHALHPRNTLLERKGKIHQQSQHITQWAGKWWYTERQTAECGSITALPHWYCHRVVWSLPPKSLT